ncbi:MAG: uroporphyrinogen decarboxylase family protein, partial [Planctomycetota bacterium]
LAALATGMERHLEALLTEPESARAVIEGATRFLSGFAAALAEAGGIPWFGDPLASGDMLGDRWFESFALPALRAVVRTAKEAAGSAAVHICGDPAAIQNSIAGIGADWVSLEVKSPAALKRHFPSSLLFGGIPTEILLGPSPSSIFSAAWERASSWPDGCVLATDCDVPALAPRENIEALVQGAREGFRAGKGVH